MLAKRMLLGKEFESLGVATWNDLSVVFVFWLWNDQQIQLKDLSYSQVPGYEISITYCNWCRSA